MTEFIFMSGSYNKLPQQFASLSIWYLIRPDRATVKSLYRQCGAVFDGFVQTGNWPQKARSPRRWL